MEGESNEWITVRGVRSTENTLQGALDQAKWDYLWDRIEELVQSEDFSSLRLELDAPGVRAADTPQPTSSDPITTVVCPGCHIRVGARSTPEGFLMHLDDHLHGCVRAGTVKTDRD